MEKKFFKELIRKLMHMSFVACAFFITHFSNAIRGIEVVLIAIGVFYYVLEQLRLQKKRIPFFSYIENIVLRESEKNQFAYAPLTLLIGIVLVMEFYTLNVAAASIIAVTIGDAMAAIMGTLFSNSPRLAWNKKKTYVGTVTNAVCVLLVCVFFFKSWKISVITSISSALVESLDLEHVDNLIIPLFVGVSLYLTVV